ncbi:MAG: transcriptional regulator [Proteobacteria bacterium]|nr:MAG: transcriptional regulator [Pseudomonadota bacterium]MBC6945865.1 transcriptional regulator [Gammaproteobacteria bacterium]MCE7895454.1 transcriptional regulator [Gammaproteobacteria bacterium PRO8]MCQ3935035.1 transcriptional regulator [Gammaproteobacteria bacterium]MDL1879851.1 helix-turn-helix transcriptional regulator [Gammaproteobacteria bacterium PRO2]
MSPTEPVSRMVEDIVGCKWSLAVIDLVRRGVCRPGAMEHAIDGLSAKVLNERLRKLQRYGILEKTSYPEIPPRVEYSLTPFGMKFSGLLDQVRQLDAELRAIPAEAPVAPGSPAARPSRGPAPSRGPRQRQQ